MANKPATISADRLPIVFSVLGDSSRLKIFKLLLKHKRQNFCVSDIARKMQTSVPAASHQLKLMEMAGIIKRRRVGKMICYEVLEDNTTIKELIKVIRKVDK